MLRIVRKEREVEKAENRLRKKIIDASDKHGTVLIGGKGWHGLRVVYWNKSLGFWWTMKEEAFRSSCRMRIYSY